MIRKLARKVKKILLPDRMKPARAYNIWSAHYDQEPHNLVLMLEEKVFNQLAENVSVTGSTVLDIGCGTGRHWAALLARQPERLTGYDISAGMLGQLKRKYPAAETYLQQSNELYATGDASCNLVLSTLTIGYIPDLRAAFAEWDRVLKPGGEIIITDFHPAALLQGGKRTFSWNKRQVEITNFIYPIEQVTAWTRDFQWERRHLAEVTIDDSLKEYFEKNNLLQVFERIKGVHMIYGLHLKKADAAT